jgi:hypothetical protein
MQQFAIDHKLQVNTNIYSELIVSARKSADTINAALLATELAALILLYGLVFKRMFQTLRLEARQSEELIRLIREYELAYSFCCRFFHSRISLYIFSFPYPPHGAAIDVVLASPKLASVAGLSDAT